jgi:hypothetical protein
MHTIPILFRLLVLGGCIACSSTPAGGTGMDGGAAQVDGGATHDGGGATPDAGSATPLTPEGLGRLAYDILKRNRFDEFYAQIVAPKEEVRASCAGLTGLDARYQSGDSSTSVQQAAFNDCRPRLNITQTELAAVRVQPTVAALEPPACTSAIPRAHVVVEARTRTSTFLFTLRDVMTFGNGARLYGLLRECGSAATVTDGGLAPPTISISANPATAVTGQAVDFAAQISGGVSPYASCEWRFLAGDNPASGTLASNTCTGRYTYSQAGDFTVSVEVVDNAFRIGRASRTYSVTPSGQPGPPDLIVRFDSLHTVNPPPQNRYARGAPIDVEFIPKNIGAGDAAATSVRVSLRDPVSRAMTTLADVAIPALAAGAEQTVRRTFTISPTQTALVYDLVAEINPDRSQTEANTSNNLVTFLWVEVVP